MNVSSDLIGINSIILVLQLGHLRLLIYRRYEAHQKHELQRTKKQVLLLFLNFGSVVYDAVVVIDMA
jgi:hypothetical protein